MSEPGAVCGAGVVLRRSGALPVEIPQMIVDYTDRHSTHECYFEASPLQELDYKRVIGARDVLGTLLNNGMATADDTSSFLCVVERLRRHLKQEEGK
eukprot:m.1655641 g.1655641  ORF g.1655641 m.1655641 type:complete len:97 (+) comp104998_c0_seq1:77-367(+)